MQKEMEKCKKMYTERGKQDIEKYEMEKNMK